MHEYRLLNLRLKAPLAFFGLENPPFSGLNVGAGENEAYRGEGAKEELFVFDEADLVDFDPDEGPKAVDILPPPRFYGLGPSPDGNKESPCPYSLPAGDYLFMQWRPAGPEEFREGLEWFAREAWWESASVKGPYAIRRVREDGGLATQILRLVSAPLLC